MKNCLTCGARSHKEYCYKHKPTLEEKKELQNKSMLKYRASEKGRIAQHKYYLKYKKMCEERKKENSTNVLCETIETQA